MSRTEALVQAGNLRESLLDHGVRAVSIEIVQGRPGGPNDGWWTKTFVGSLGHHIVSKRSQGLTPFLWLVKKGRTDLPGPICNGYGGFDEIARIICMGWANHPGAGGPLTTELGTIPANNGRPYLFGWEFEGGVVESDWPDSMRNFMGSCHAGTLDWIGSNHNRFLTERSHFEHKTWAPTRKVDRLGYTLESARTEVARVFDKEEDLTPLQARLEVATAWYQKAGVWMDAAGGEDPQARLTRLANAVYTKERTVEDIVRFVGRVRNPDPGEAVPAWVLDPSAPYAAPIYGANSNTTVNPHHHDSRYVRKGTKTITLT